MFTIRRPDEEIIRELNKLLLDAKANYNIPEAGQPENRLSEAPSMTVTKDDEKYKIELTLKFIRGRSTQTVPLDTDGVKIQTWLKEVVTRKINQD